jgi:hypothetical protein
MSDKIFIGKVEKKETKFGEMIKISLGAADIQKLSENLNEKGWINLVMKNGKNGNSYIEVDTWKPTVAKAPEPAGFDGQDELPF